MMQYKIQTKALRWTTTTLALCTQFGQATKESNFHWIVFPLIWIKLKLKEMYSSFQTTKWERNNFISIKINSNDFPLIHEHTLACKYHQGKVCGQWASHQIIISEWYRIICDSLNNKKWSSHAIIIILQRSHSNLGQHWEMA